MSKYPFFVHIVGYYLTTDSSISMVHISLVAGTVIATNSIGTVSIQAAVVSSIRTLIMVCRAWQIFSRKCIYKYVHVAAECILTSFFLSLLSFHFCIASITLLVLKFQIEHGFLAHLHNALYIHVHVSDIRLIEPILIIVPPLLHVEEKC